MDEKNDRYIINGAHDAEKLASLLDVFIDKFVLCHDCKNPETEFQFAKNDDISMDCKACGAHSQVDPRLKLVPYIQKNKPEQKKDMYKKVNASDRAGNADEPEEEEEDTMEAELAALPTAEEVDVGDDWAADTSADAVAARIAELAVSGKLIDQEDDEQDPAELFADYITNQSELVDELIVEKAEELGIREDKAITILAQVLFNGDILKDAQVEYRAPLLKLFLQNDKCQKGLIGGIERLVAITHPELLGGVSLIFKDLYFNDLVEEEVFLAWSEKVSKRYVEKKYAKMIREKAEPFVTWLKEAEEEE
jgi:translation initiation factor 5